MEVSMKKLLLLPFLFLIGIIFAGCATTGAIPNLKKGETTKDDVRSMLGEPEKKESSGETEQWIYKFMKEGRGEAGQHRKTTMKLTVVFKGKTMESYELSIVQGAEDEMREPKGEPPPRPMPRRPPGAPPPGPMPY